MYQILINAKRDTAITINLTQGFLALPAHLRVGVGKRSKAYQQWLEKMLAENTDFSMMLAALHRSASEKDLLVLLVPERYRWQAETLETFLCEHDHSLTAMMSYTSLGQQSGLDMVSPEVMAKIRAQMASGVLSDGARVATIDLDPVVVAAEPATSVALTETPTTPSLPITALLDEVIEELQENIDAKAVHAAALVRAILPQAIL